MVPADTVPLEVQPSSAAPEVQPMIKKELLDSSTDSKDALVLIASPFHDILTCGIEPPWDTPATPRKSLGTAPVCSHMTSQAGGAPRTHPLPFGLSHPVTAVCHVRKQEANSTLGTSLEWPAVKRLKFSPEKEGRKKEANKKKSPGKLVESKEEKKMKVKLPTPEKKRTRKKEKKRREKEASHIPVPLYPSSGRSCWKMYPLPQGI